MLSRALHLTHRRAFADPAWMSSVAQSTVVGVEHDAAGGTFSIAVPGGRGVLSYRLVRGPGAPTVVDILSTRVPASARGLGTAKTLSDAAFTFARQEGALVRPSCSYTRDTYLAKGADGKPFVLDDEQGLVHLK